MSAIVFTLLAGFASLYVNYKKFIVFSISYVDIIHVTWKNMTHQSSGV